MLQTELGGEGSSEIEEYTAAYEVRGCSLDPGDLIAFRGHHRTSAASVPCAAVIEDVTEPIPLCRALQRHSDDVISAAEAVGEPLGSEFCIHTGVCHRVHWVGAASPTVLRAVRVESLSQREYPARLHQPCRLHALRVIEEVQRSQDIIRAPSAPVRASLGHRLDARLCIPSIHSVSSPSVGVLKLVAGARAAAVWSWCAASVMSVTHCPRQLGAAEGVLSDKWYSPGEYLKTEQVTVSECDSPGESGGPYMHYPGAPSILSICAIPDIVSFLPVGRTQ